jgi:hypothetical protein
MARHRHGAVERLYARRNHAFPNARHVIAVIGWRPLWLADTAATGLYAGLLAIMVPKMEGQTKAETAAIRGFLMVDIVAVISDPQCLLLAGAFFTGPLALGFCVEHWEWHAAPLVVTPIAIAGIIIGLQLRRTAAAGESMLLRLAPSPAHPADLNLHFEIHHLSDGIISQ